MERYVWLFPLLFIFHDMEEIIGFGIWYKRNKVMLDERFPAISKSYADYSTEGMAAAVYEELILCIVFSIIAIYTGKYALWLGGFIAYTLHLVMHIGQSIVLRDYIPALTTSIIALPVSIWIINRCIKLMEYSAGTVVLYSIIGTIVVGVNLRFAHILLAWFTRWMNTKLGEGK